MTTQSQKRPATERYNSVRQLFRERICKPSGGCKFTKYETGFLSTYRVCEVCGTKKNSGHIQ